MAGTPLRNLQMFAELCGDKFARNVVFLTTMWDKARSLRVAEKREVGLKERYWNAVIHHGATVNRFYMDDPRSAWTIVDNVIQRHQLGEALLLQEEVVDLGKRLNETNAGKVLRGDLQELLNKQIETIKFLEEQIQGMPADADIEQELVALRAEAKNISQELESMKIPLHRRVAYSSIKRSQASM